MLGRRDLGREKKHSNMGLWEEAGKAVAAKVLCSSCTAGWLASKAAGMVKQDRTHGRVPWC